MTKRFVRPIRIEGDIAYVPLNQGYEAVIDAADVHLVAGFNWTASVRRRKDGSVLKVYAGRIERPGNRCIRMHRLIAGTPDGADTDHIDSDGLNNRRSNLRTATRSQNAQNSKVRIDNSSGIKGVFKVKSKWRAIIWVDKRKITLGTFVNRDDAAVAITSARAKLHGEFGRSQ